MPLFQYTDRTGTGSTFTGPQAIERGAEQVFFDVLGCSFVDAIRAFGKVIFLYEGKEHVFSLTMRAVQVEAVRSQSNISDLTSAFSQIANKIGFIDCPECKAIHDRKVTHCRKCGYNVEIPDDMKEKLRDHFDDEAQPQEEPQEEPEAPDQLEEEEEQQPPSALHMMGTDDEAEQTI